MTKKKLTRRLYASIGVLLFVGLLAVVGGVKAFQSYEVPPKVVVEGDYIEAESPDSPFVEESFGALAGPNLPYDYLVVGGVAKYYYKADMRAATTTLCSFPMPITSATTTLESFDYQIITGTSTASSLVVSASSNVSGTSTVSNIVSAQTVGSGAKDSMSWLSGGTADLGEISPGENVLLMTEGAGLGGYTFTGTCQAVFRSMPE